MALATANSSISNLETILSVTQSDLADTQSELSNTETVLATTQSDLSDTQSELVSIQDSLLSTELDLATANTTIGGLNTDLDAANITIAVIESTLTSTEASLSTSEESLSATQDSLMTAMLNQEDGINQSHVDIAYNEGYNSGVIFGESEFSPVEVDAFIFLPEGWSLFGYTCIESIDVIDAFIEISDNIIIAKDYNGMAYFPEFNFNGIGDLVYGMGYQIKLTQEIEDFQFCPQLLPSDN